MTQKLKFDLVSPERLLLSDEVDMVSVPGTEGDFGVLVHHCAMMSVLRPGIVTVEDEGNSVQFFVQGGFADVTPEGLTLLVEKAVAVADFSKGDIEAEIKLAVESDNMAVVDALELLRAGL